MRYKSQKELIPEFMKTLPAKEELQEGVIYISKKYNVSKHLCPCGCKNLVVLPFNHDDGWDFKESEGMVTFSPSIGNWSLPCESHYYIKKNMIEFC